MGQYIRRAIVGAILGSCSALLFIWYSAAHSHHPQGEFVAGLREFGRVFRRERATAHEIGKNHQLVKEAFRDVIAEANEATVSVWVNNKQVALGTVVSAHGLVLTKLSELEGGLQVKVGSELYRATVWRRIRDLDLALVQVEAAPKLQPVTFAPDPQTPQVGSLVAAPGGLAELPLALGIVSSAEHSILRELALLGVLPVDDPEGVRVDSVENGSSADRLGINENDIISKVGSESIRSAEHLRTVIRSYSAGDDVELLIRRADDSRLVTLRASLGSLFRESSEEEGHTGGPLNDRRSGFDRVIQHDCTLRSNQCGGPLVDAQGRVIGINIAKAGRVEMYALPIAIVQQHLDSIATSPRPQQPQIAIRAPQPHVQGAG